MKNYYFVTVRNLDFEFRDEHLEIVKKTSEEYYSRHIVTNIVKQDMDEVFEKYLSSIHLSQYQWFFNELDYWQIMSIDESNIRSMIAMVNRKNGNGHSIKEGCQKKICKFTKAMRHRSLKICALKQVIQRF